MNKIILKGRLTHTPELKKTDKDVSVCTFTLAVDRKHNREVTDFINCEAWRGTADFVSKYFGRGKEMLLIGELHIDKKLKDGENRYYTKVIAEDVEFCGSKNDVPQTMPKDETEAKSFSQGDFVDVETINDDEDLPF